MRHYDMKGLLSLWVVIGSYQVRNDFLGTLLYGVRILWVVCNGLFKPPIKSVPVNRNTAKVLFLNFFYVLSVAPLCFAKDQAVKLLLIEELAAHPLTVSVVKL